MVKEAAEILAVALVIEVGPFLGIVDTQPLFLRGHAPEAVYGASGVQLAGVAGDHIGGHPDLLQLSGLIPPVVVHQRVLAHHGLEVFHKALAIGHARPGIGEVGDAAAHILVLIHIGMALPGRYRRQMRRILRGHIPLGYGKPGVSDHGHPAVAPGLRAQELDNIVVVVTVLGAEIAAVALRRADAADIHVHDGIAPGHPPGRIGRFPGLKPGQGPLRYSVPAGDIVNRDIGAVFPEHR